MSGEEPRPLDAQTGAEMPPLEQPGYYPGYHTLSQQAFWDETTRHTVLKRVNDLPPIHFFSLEEAHLLHVVCEHVLPQSDRARNRRIPLVPFIDQRLHEGRSPGYRHEKMPPDGEAHRLGLRAIAQMAEELHGKPFVELTWHEQEVLLRSLRDAKPLGAHELWAQMPIERFWLMLVTDCVEVYYAHPWAWDEIGFGGPAYPRAYMRLEGGEPEPWEAEEKRYEWIAPPQSLSDLDEEEVTPHHQHPGIGQEGTH